MYVSTAAIPDDVVCETIAETFRLHVAFSCIAISVWTRQICHLHNCLARSKKIMSLLGYGIGRVSSLAKYLPMIHGAGKTV